jgi:hypothetical protein
MPAPPAGGVADAISSAAAAHPTFKAGGSATEPDAAQLAAAAATAKDSLIGVFASRPQKALFKNIENKTQSIDAKMPQSTYTRPQPFITQHTCARGC